jgi:hypothetical protein
MAARQVEESAYKVRTAGAAQSSVQSMTVAEVRRALSSIRKTWEDQHADAARQPFYLSTPLADVARSQAQSAEHFSLLFVLAHHTRRLAKTKLSVQAV